MKTEIQKFFRSVLKSESLSSKLKKANGVNDLYKVYKSSDGLCSKKVFFKVFSTVLGVCCMFGSTCCASFDVNLKDVASKFSNLKIEDFSDLEIKNKALKGKDKAKDFYKDHKFLTISTALGLTSVASVLIGTPVIAKAVRVHNFNKHNEDIKENFLTKLRTIDFSEANNDLHTAIGNVKNALNGDKEQCDSIVYNDNVSYEPKLKVKQALASEILKQTSILKDVCREELEIEKEKVLKTKNYKPLELLVFACENAEQFVLGDKMVKEKFVHITDVLWNALGKVIEYGKANKKSVFGDGEIQNELTRVKDSFRGAFRF